MQHFLSVSKKRNIECNKQSKASANKPKTSEMIQVWSANSND